MNICPILLLLNKNKSYIEKLFKTHGLVYNGSVELVEPTNNILIID